MKCGLYGVSIILHHLVSQHRVSRKRGLGCVTCLKLDLEDRVPCVLRHGVLRNTGRPQCARDQVPPSTGVQLHVWTG